MSQVKVGDKIRIYGLDKDSPETMFDRYVSMLHTDGIIVTNKAEHVHPKQCRKLVKKNRRIVFIAKNELDDAFNKGDYAPAWGDHNGFEKHEMIEFREVIKK